MSDLITCSVEGVALAFVTVAMATVLSSKWKAFGGNEASAVDPDQL